MWYIEDGDVRMEIAEGSVRLSMLEALDIEALDRAKYGRNMTIL